MKFAFMKVRDIIKAIEADGWYLINMVVATVNINIRPSRAK